MFVVRFINAGRQDEVHHGVPHGLFGGSPKSASVRGERVATEVADRDGTGQDRDDRDGTSDTRAAIDRANRRASSSIVTVIVTSEKLVESVGENAEEAGGSARTHWDDARWCLNHGCLAPFVYRRMPP
jgi:hypothetical protein